MFDGRPLRVPPQFPDDLLDEAVAVLQPRARRELTREDAREALYNLSGVFELLLQWKKDKLARADVIDVSKLSGDTIKFGATVTLIDEDTDEKKVWQIVGEPEANAKDGKISITSPLARALIGKKKGANVEVVTPGGAKAYEIKKVDWK